ncbi:MAG TPA: Gfo/Idh/MocA family oxidoreductase [Luteitalea sp.]|nr:Gfo/Idh/MocA family oxidoreductase [Luteitalea sp.]
MPTTRRTFLTAASGLALAPRLAAASVQGANDRIRIGVIGTGNRARGLMNTLKTIKGVELATVCDVYETSLDRAMEHAPGATRVADYRRVLDDKTIDAVLIGTPDHWHRTITIDAIKAGKDVYVEKPISRTIEEGEAMVQAVEASKQVVQTGTQQRSWAHFKIGKDLIAAGRLGQISFVQTYWYQQPGLAGPPKVDTARLDWRAWQGPATNRAFDADRFTYWRHFWDYGGGGFTDLLTHWIDIVHWYMDVEAPLSVVATGANHIRKHWEAPDTSTASIEFPKEFSTTYVGSFNNRTDDGGLEFRGSEATMKIDRQRLAIYPRDGQNVPGTRAPEPSVFERSTVDGGVAHLQNWVDCMRSRQKPNADIRIGHVAARTSHLANIALREKRRVSWDGKKVL